MATNVILTATRIEDLVREVENEDTASLADFIQRTGLSFPEFGAILGELIATRKIADVGSGAIVNFRGNVRNEGVPGIYKRMKFKFHVEIGAPRSKVTGSELQEIAQRTIEFMLQKVGAEFEQFEAEMREHERKENERVTKTDREEVIEKPN